MQRDLRPARIKTRWTEQKSDEEEEEEWRGGEEEAEYNCFFRKSLLILIPACLYLTEDKNRPPRLTDAPTHTHHYKLI